MFAAKAMEAVANRAREPENPDAFYQRLLTQCWREAHRILKPGGILVLETPRYDTLAFKLLGKRERSLSCDGHIYFFTSDTLAQIAKKVGFTIMKSDCVGRSLTLQRLFYNFGVISKNPFLQRLLKQIATQFQLNKIWFNLNARDMERIYLKKPEFLSE